MKNNTPADEKAKMQPDDTKTETAEDSQHIKMLVMPLYESLPWIRLFAACLIFYGALTTVTGIGVLVAWIPMWIGVLLLLASNSISTAYKENSEQAFKLSISRLKTIFTTLGLASVALIVASIYLLKYAIEKSLF